MKKRNGNGVGHKKAANGLDGRGTKALVRHVDTLVKKVEGLSAQAGRLQARALRDVPKRELLAEISRRL